MLNGLTWVEGTASQDRRFDLQNSFLKPNSHGYQRIRLSRLGNQLETLNTYRKTPELAACD